MKYLQTYEKFNLYQKLFGKDENVSENGELKDIKFGEKSSNVRKLQENLVEIGFNLPAFGIDSKFGWETLSVFKSVLSFLKTHPEFKEFIDSDDILVVKNNNVSIEQQELLNDLSQDDDFKSEVKAYMDKLDKEINDSDLVNNPKYFEFIEDKEAFVSKLVEISKKLRVNPNWLMLVFWKESKINPKAVNEDTQASGLIQFIPKTAKGLGTSVQAIQQMSGVEQLDYVYKYFKPYTGRIKSAQDLYLVTFFPVAMGKDDDFILQTKNLSANVIASKNPAIDLNKDGEITKGEFNDYVIKGLPKDLKDNV